MTSPTHVELVARAARWLRYSCQLRTGYRVSGEPRRETVRCAVVFCELVTSAPETPDAIGFANGGGTSVLIECKTSRADFHKDKTKWHRRGACGMGDYRFIIAPDGLLTPAEMADDWGLLSVRGRRVRIERDATERWPSERLCFRPCETKMLWSYCRRMQTHERESGKAE